MKLTHDPHRHRGRVMRSVAGALGVAGLALVIAGDGHGQTAQQPTHQAIQNQITTHDGNQTSQHNAQSSQATTHNSAQSTQHNNLSGQVTTHDSAQTTQHNSLSQKIDDLSTSADHSGLPPTWDKVLPPDPILPSVVPCRLGTSSRWKCVMGGAAVLDKETGLVWEQSPDTTSQNWLSSRFLCINKNVGGRQGWRLPSVPELASLVDPNNVDPTFVHPALPPGHPFTNVQSANYWSASTNAGDPSGAWSVFFGGGLGGTGTKTNAFLEWCVRGGMNADQY